MLNCRSSLYFFLLKSTGFEYIMLRRMDWHHLVWKLQILLYSSRDKVLADHKVLPTPDAKALKGFLIPCYCSVCFSLPSTAISSLVKMYLRA